MPDYIELYLTLFRATEQAIQTLISAQQACEELYLNDTNQNLCFLPKNQAFQDKGNGEPELEPVE